MAAAPVDPGDVLEEAERAAEVADRMVPRRRGQRGIPQAASPVFPRLSILEAFIDSIEA